MKLPLLILLATPILICCASPRRVNLGPIPERDASLDERQRAYSELRPLNFQERTRAYAVPVGNFAVAGSYRYIDYLQLRSGDRVLQPEDLLQVADPGSKTAAAVGRWRKRTDEADAWRTGMWTTMAITAAAGIAVGTVGVGLSFLSAERDADVSNVAIAVAVGGYSSVLAVPALSGLLFLVPVSHANEEALRERETAFLMYDSSLREHLGLDPR